MHACCSRAEEIYLVAAAAAAALEASQHFPVVVPVLVECGGGYWLALRPCEGIAVSVTRRHFRR